MGRLDFNGDICPDRGLLVAQQVCRRFIENKTYGTWKRYQPSQKTFKPVLRNSAAYYEDFSRLSVMSQSSCIGEGFFDFPWPSFVAAGLIKDHWQRVQSRYFT